MSYTYLHYMFFLLNCKKKYIWKKINQNDWDDGYQRASNSNYII